MLCFCLLVAYHLRRERRALAGVAQSVAALSCKLKVVGFVPGQGTVAGSVPGLVHAMAPDQCLSLTLVFLSLALPPFPSL